jgi:hypothetical protein
VFGASDFLSIKLFLVELTIALSGIKDSLCWEIETFGLELLFTV